MSLIYDALRKSEQQRRAGEVPTLATDPGWGVRRTPPPRRGRRWLPWLLVPALAGLGFAGWYASRHLHPAPTEVAGVTDAPAAAAAPGAPAPAPVTVPAELAARFAEGDTFASDPRALLAGVPRPPPVPEPAPAAPSSAASADAGGFAAAAQAAAAAMTDPARDASAAVAAPADVAAARVDAASAGSAPAARAMRDVPAPAEPALPLVYELPYALRKDLPKLTLSMHVYHADPARRFAIINDERRGEGEAVGGVRIVTIRRDGLELEYAGQRFLLPRSG